LTINHLIPRPNSQIQPPVEMMMATRKAIFKINRRILFANGPFANWLLANWLRLSADDVPASLNRL
jgi:hypothetical protein